MKFNKKEEDKILEVRNSGQVTRTDIATLLAMIAKPGKKRDEKREAIARLHLENPQGYKVEDDLEGYDEF